jgi:23S rRNA-/tRNA-specific pseudouridylate synthase
MPGRRRRQATDTGEDRWIHALEYVLSEDGVVLQMVGLESPTRTAFARIQINSNNKNHETAMMPTMGRIVQWIVQEYHILHPEEERDHDVLSEFESKDELLLRLGSVWILELVSNNKSHPQNSHNQKETWRRASTRMDDQDRRWNPTITILLRVHCRPARFVTPKSLEIVYHTIPDFIIVNKPGTMPSHGTVDNAVENVLSMVREQFHNHLDYAVLPQRLDTETSGLLLVATSKLFGAYLSKLLEQKTVLASPSSATRPAPPFQPQQNQQWLTKRYRCLVYVEDRESRERLNELQQSQSLVTHYLDESSKAPKTFVATIPKIDDDDDQPDRAASTSHKCKWLDCHLRLASVGEAVPLTIHLLSALLGHDDAIDDVDDAVLPQQLVVEVEVELLTGRTHQIRGQLAAIQCPIVGDVLYGAGAVVRSAYCGGSTQKTTRNRMALQCCAMTFAAPDKTPRPEWSKKKCWHPSSNSDSYSFSLDEAWWTKLLLLTE